MCQKEVDGFWYTAGDDIDTESASFLMRQAMFMDSNAEYKRNARVCGFLYHDLQSNMAGIPPGITVKVELWRNKGMKWQI